ncbi:ABC transporter substrate-binding protein, partial [Enterococcus faecium]|uniref:ABC transporter substrate-binding protein n=1 Tax=Enterococcus faecium TaxID=1352 RepID=UPI003F425419
MLRVFSHTCSNTEIVCALGAAQCLVGVDDDSDFPPGIVAGLPKLGRDLDLRVAEVAELAPDLVLTSLTVPGHERIVAELEALGLRTLV